MQLETGTVPAGALEEVPGVVLDFKAGEFAVEKVLLEHPMAKLAANISATM